MSSFKYVITKRANEKDDYLVAEMSVEEFVKTFTKRGHKPGAKDGSGIIGAVFRKHSRLEQKNVELCTAVILDVDGKFKRNGEVVLEPVDPDWFIGQLPFRGLAHTSYNHTPAHPKYRVILPLSRPVTKEEHRRIWYWFFEKVQHKVDPSCKNADRMFFLPRAPEEAVKQEWCWIRELHGPVLTPESVPADFEVPEEIAHSHDKPRRMLGLHPAAPETRFAFCDGHKLLEQFKKHPLTKWAMDEPSQVSREVWRGLATNLAAIALEEPDDESLEEECLNTFHEISEQDLERYRAPDTTRMFNEGMKSAKQYGPITYSHMAENGAPDECCMADTKTMIATSRQVVRFQEAKATSPKGERPAANPTLSVETLPGTEKTDSPDYGAEEGPPAAPAEPSSPPQSTTAAPPTTPPTPRSPTSSSAPAASSAPASAPATGTASPADVDDPDPGDGDDDQSKTFLDLKPEEFLHDADQHMYLMRAANGDWDIAKPMVVGAFDTWLLSYGIQDKQLKNWKSRIRSFNGRRSFFSKPTEIAVDHEGVIFFNTYRPGKIIPGPGDWSDIKALVMNLAGNDPEAFEYFMDWLALPIQKIVYEGTPFKMGTSVVLHGEQGSGKGTLHTILKLIYGIKNVLLMDQDMMDGRFNDQLIDKLFVTANEVVSSTNRSMQTANKIKMWVTDPVIRLEGKFDDGEEHDNQFNIIFTSNDDRPVIIERGDRRFTVFFSKKFDRKVSSRIYDDIAGDKKQVAAFLDALLKRQVRVSYGDLFDTEAKRKMTLASAPSEERFVMDIVSEGWLAVSKPWVEDARQDKPRVATSQVDDEVVVLSGTLQEVYRDWCKKNGLRACGVQKLMTALGDVLKDLEGDRKRVGGIVTRFWKKMPMHPPGEVLDFPPPSTDKKLELVKTDAGNFTA